MEERDSLNRFNKGMNKDTSPQFQPEGTWMHMLNGVISSKEGDVYTLTCEDGNVADGDPLSWKLHCIGSCVLEQEKILFLVDDNGNNSAIAVHDALGNYQIYVACNPFGTVTLQNGVLVGTLATQNELSFKKTHQIEAVARIAFNQNRIVYFTDDLNPPRFLNLDKIPTTNLGENIALIPNGKIPTVDLEEVLDTGGTTKVGSYQFVARLLTESLNPAPFGLVCQPIPIVDDAVSKGRYQVDGNDLDAPSSKSIKISINNIDTDYKYLEVYAIFNTGVSSDTVISKFVSREITSDSMEFIYTGESDDDVAITEDELLTINTNYTKAKCIAQKDSRLFLSNLATDSVEDFQSIANDIEVFYTVEEQLCEYPFNYSAGTRGTLSAGTTNLFDDYKNPDEVFRHKGYQRDEVYSLAIVFIYKNGSTSPAFHIPARNGHSLAAVQLSPGYGEVGTYTSTELYPSGLNHTTPGAGLRHHKMPTLEQEPHFRADVSYQLYTRVLGLEFQNIVIPANIQAKLQGYTIVRQKRDITNNKSILAQGMPQKYWGNSTKLHPSGLFGNIKTDFNYLAFVRFINDSDTHTGGQPTVDNIVSFHAPEVILKDDIRNKLKGYLLRPVQPVSGNFWTTACQPLPNGDSNWYMHGFCDFNNIGSPLPVLPDIVIDSSAYLNPNDSSLTFDSKPAHTVGNEGHTAMKLNANFTNPPGHADDTFRVTANSGPSYEMKVNGNVHTNPWDEAATVYKYLCNIVNPLTAQYGTLEDAEYIVVQDTLTNLTGSTLDPFPSTLECFNGDTFISKFAYKHSVSINGLSNLLLRGITVPGPEIRCVGYFMVESMINCNFRHRFRDNVTGATGIDYFPHNLSLSTEASGTLSPSSTSILDQTASYGEADQYNPLYSKEQDLQIFHALGTGFEEVTDFPCRTIYSDVSLEGEKVDMYRNFKIASVHDIPKHSGEIWNTFIHNGRLYLHTTGSLWKTFFNEATTTSSSTGDLIVGSGLEFSLPSAEMFTEAGGYAGTQSQWAGVYTPFGYMFPDIRQKKIFILADGLQEISMDGMWKWLAENLSIKTPNPGTTSNTDINTFLDNPANPDGVGLIACYDYKNKLFIVTKRDGDGIVESERDGYKNDKNSFTLTYSPIFKQWVGFHSYLPTNYVTLDTEVYALRNDKLSTQKYVWKQGAGLKGQYFGDAVKPFDIVVSLNQDALTTKVFDNLLLYTTSYDETNEIHKPLDTFNKVQYYNTNQNTDITDLVIGTNIHRIEDNKFRLHVLRSIVVNPLLNIFDSGNLDLSLLFKERMRSTFIIAKLRYDNTNNYKFNFSALTTALRKSYK